VSARASNVGPRARLRSVNGLRGTVAAVLVAGALAACSDRPPTAEPAPSASSTRPTSDVPEQVPGAPGEDSSTRDPSAEVGQPSAEHDDVGFMQMMVLHHRQALDLAALVPDRSTDARVREVAARIEAAQAPEILVMAQWLTERSIDVPGVHEDPALYDHAQHGHAGMAGMLTADELDALEQSEGGDFDRSFLEDMVRHHRGAVEMSRYVLEHGSDVQVNELATGIVVEQSAEIVRLERILADL
jgi:uncharacterized protein (DUF305 family)